MIDDVGNANHLTAAQGSAGTGPTPAAPADCKSNQRMTVREVAAVLGVTDEAIKKHIRELWPELMRNGERTYLTEEQVTEIKRKMTPTTKVAGALTSLDIERMTLQVIDYHKAKIAELEAKAAEDKPKVDFFDTVAASADALSMREAAAVLNLPGWGRNSIFKALRKAGVLDGHNIPYRNYQERGYFRVVERKWTDPEGETHVELTTLVYQRGIDFIRQKLTEASRIPRTTSVVTSEVSRPVNNTYAELRRCYAGNNAS